ncbi:MAG: type II 3-dehydroquinate dehydratase [Salegentibacter sp.]|uniref:3-dehydroquinate dehydratase n=1 Tax=Salegentibacter flavus TaxID=287099 RepID=A0A1I5BR61_9FLAO|nr:MULTISPECIES: type II 3-dehydroquinate dehydratase [Salegentibacter]MDR9457692.1 type II 3-dehydroquinate dehydratase [Salegentibacter sp.]SFN77157.1 3-dehydroquinate dehydratase [Salegentibacter flavus]
MKILIINGPNLNLLGTREPDTYGNKKFEDYFVDLQLKFGEVELSYFQSNIEGEIIDELHRAVGEFDGVVLNAAAYTHTSVGIGDAVKAIEVPVVEVHISNTHSREEFRHKSFIAPVAKGVILGFGLQSYDLAIQSFINSKK